VTQSTVTATDASGVPIEKVKCQKQVQTIFTRR
jgi:hypothetical protein